MADVGTGDRFKRAARTMEIEIDLNETGMDEGTVFLSKFYSRRIRLEMRKILQ